MKYKLDNEIFVPIANSTSPHDKQFKKIIGSDYDYIFYNSETNVLYTSSTIPINLDKLKNASCVYNSNTGTETIYQYTTKDGDTRYEVNMKNIPNNSKNTASIYKPTIWDIKGITTAVSFLFLIDKKTGKVMAYITYEYKKDIEQIYIIYVSISPEYQGRGLCNKLMKFFIYVMECTYGNVTFKLANIAGGIYSCKCYSRAFSDMNYNDIHNVNCSKLPNNNSSIEMKFKKKKNTFSCTISGGYRKTKYKRYYKKRRTTKK